MHPGRHAFGALGSQRGTHTKPVHAASGSRRRSAKAASKDVRTWAASIPAIRLAVPSAWRCGSQYPLGRPLRRLV